MRKSNTPKWSNNWQLAVFLLGLMFSTLNLLGQVTLANQNAVNNFPRHITQINGSLNIGGSSAMSDITNLSPLANIKTIGGDLNITFNGKLSNLNALGNIRSVGGRIFITNNPNLSNCISLFDLINSRGVIISNNNSGCNSISEILKEINRCGGLVNNADSDGDGIVDCADGCPFDPNKTSPGLCGCGNGGDGDNDQDGTPNCEDGCPNDRLKTAPGVCGCGNIDTPDSDGDGTYDCDDECPNNPYLIQKGICGCEAPTITHVSMNHQSDCNDQNTNDESDDTYQATVTVEFAWPPKLGAIRFRGATNHRFDFSNDNDDQTAFSFSLTFPADGQKVDFTVEYIGNETCFYRFKQATAFPPCSDLVCDIPTNMTPEVEGNQVKIGWDYVADWMSYEYRYRQLGTTEWTYQWTDQNEITICDLGMNQEYEYGIRAYCGDDRQSDFANGAFQAGEEETACLASTDNEDCVIQHLEIVNIQKCYDRGTAYPLDDYFYADVVVYFQNPPIEGELQITGNTNIEIDASDLEGQTNYRFRRLKIMENGGQIDLTATFSEDESCTFNIKYPIPENPCSLDSRGRSRATFTNTHLEIEELTISPNPAHDVLTVEVPPIENGQLMIFDVLGKRIWQQSISPTSQRVNLTIAHFERGLYQLVVQNKERIVSRKFIKQ